MQQLSRPFTPPTSQPRKCNQLSIFGYYIRKIGNRGLGTWGAGPHHRLSAIAPLPSVAYSSIQTEHVLCVRLRSTRLLRLVQTLSVQPQSMSEVTSARQTRAFSSFDATSSNGSPSLSKIQYMLINKRQRVSKLYNGFCRPAYIVKCED
jgi:hypothetical protein